MMEVEMKALSEYFYLYEMLVHFLTKARHVTNAAEKHPGTS